MGYDRGDSFPFDFEPNGFSFDSKSKGKLLPRSYLIQCDRKWRYSFLSDTLSQSEEYLSIALPIKTSGVRDGNFPFVMILNRIIIN